MMNEMIEKAIILSECELAVLAGAQKRDEFFGYPILPHSLSLDGRLEGVNSLIRRGLLLPSENGYSLSEESGPVLHCITGTERTCTLSGGLGIIYCANNVFALLRRIRSEPVRFSVIGINAVVLMTILSDLALLPGQDEDDFMDQQLPDDLGDIDIMDSADFAITANETGSSLGVMRIGLCMAVIWGDAGMVKCEPYSRNSFLKKLDSLLKGGSVSNDNDRNTFTRS